MLFYLLFMVVFIPEWVCSSEPVIIPWNMPDTLLQGGKVKLMCSLSKGSQPVKFTWQMNNHNVYETNDLFVQNLDDASILNIKNLQLIHNSNISCEATNRFGKDVFTSYLTVNAPPVWVKKPPEKLNLKVVDSAEQAILDCVANGMPNPSIKWSKVSSLTKNSKDNAEQTLIKSLPNGTLVLDISKSNEGEFVCTVDNKIGDKLTSRTQVIIQTPPQIVMIDDRGKELGENDVIFARKGESFSIRCQAHGDRPLSVNWSKNHELMQYKFSSNMETLESLSPSGMISELHFRSIERSDSGIYECRVKNDLGESKRSQKLVVLEPPDPPNNLKISDLDSTSVRLSWQLSFNGNLELNKINIYYWESNNKNKLTGNHKLKLIEIDQVTSTWQILKSLKSGIAYTIAVTCVNRIGESALSELVQFETKMRNPTTPPTDLTIRKLFSNKILISWKYSSQELQGANVTGFQVFYKSIDEPNYYIERMAVRDHESENEQFHLTLVNLKKNTKYLIKVKSYNKEGFSGDSEEIECYTLRGNVPNPPRIMHHQVHSKSYLIVKWEHIQSTTLNAALRHEDANEHQQQLIPKTTSNDESTSLQESESFVQLFMVYVEVSDLKMIVQTIPIPAIVHQVTIANLDKDVQYNIYISATNQYGESELSEPLIVTIRSYQYEMSIFIAERNAIFVTAISIGATAILVSIICSIIYMKKFQLAQQEKLRKMSTLTLSKCGTNKTTATYATIGNTPTTSTALTNYNAQHAQLTPINTSAYLANHQQQQPCSSGYQEIGLTYDLTTGGLSSATKLTPHHLPLSTFGHVTIRSDASNTQSSDNEDVHHAVQIKDRFRQSNKSLDSMKNMRINYDELIYDDFSQVE